MRKSTEFVKNALAFFWGFSGCVWHFFGTFLTSFGIFSDFQSGNPGIYLSLRRDNYLCAQLAISACISYLCICIAKSACIYSAEACRRKT